MLVRFGELRGMNQHPNAKPGEAALVNDMSHDARGHWRECRGVEKLFQVSGGSDPLGAVGAVESMAWFSQHGAREWLVWEMQPTGFTDTSLSLVAFNGSTRSYDVIQAGRTHHAGPWFGTSYAAHGGWLYYVNGLDTPACWDGERQDAIGFSGPSGRVEAATRSTAAAAGASASDYVDWVAVFNRLHNGDTYAVAAENNVQQRGLGDRAANGNPAGAERWMYGYRLAWVNARGQEAPPSEMVLVRGTNYGRDTSAAAGTFTGGGKLGVRVEIPSPPAQARGFRLYRTRNIEGVSPVDALNTTCYLAYECGYAMRHAMWDFRPDDELGRELDMDATGPFPPDAHLLAVYASRLWTVASGEPDVLRYSTRGYLEQFPVVNRLRVGARDAGRIVAIVAYRDALVVLKERGTYLVEDRGGTVSFTTLSEDVGGVGPRAIAEAPGLGLVFVSQNGFKLLTSALSDDTVARNVVDIGLPVLELFEQRVNVGALCQAFVVHARKERELQFYLPEHGGARPTLGFVLHYATGVWSTRTGWPYNCGVETGGPVAQTFLGGGTSDARGVWVETRGLVSGAAASKRTSTLSLNPLWKSAPLRPGARTDIRRVDLRCVGIGRTYTLRVFNDRMWTSTTGVETRLDLDAERDHQVWETGLWDATQVWQDYRLGEVTVPYDSVTDGAGLEQAVQVSASRMRLATMEVELRGTGPDKLDSQYDRRGP